MMTRTRGLIAAELLALAGGLGMGAAWVQQDQGPAEKAGSKLDDVGRSIKRRLDSAGDAVREQFERARGSVHNMDVASRVYGRIHWDKTLTTSTLDLDVRGGVVTLRGAVPDARTKAKAVELAADTVGISKVIDQLAIEPPPRTAPDTSTDVAPKS
jgi:hyperosmotically inducible periplasmic protein